MSSNASATLGPHTMMPWLAWNKTLLPPITSTSLSPSLSSNTRPLKTGSYATSSKNRSEFWWHMRSLNPLVQHSAVA